MHLRYVLNIYVNVYTWDAYFSNSLHYMYYYNYYV